MPQPPAEVILTTASVERLIRAQHPDLAAPVRPAARGWGNAVYRLGDTLAVRLPVRAVAAPLIRNEQRWLPAIAARLPVAVPAPLAVGEPGESFPWHWSIVPWFSGTPASAVDPQARDDIAVEFAQVLLALHTPAPSEAPHNPVRGVPLAARAAAVEPRFIDSPRLREIWQDGCDAPTWPNPPVWVHGDVHPGNLVLQSGGIHALIDFGDMCAGDPACDLAIAWLGFTATGRARFVEALEGAYDPHIWTRAQAWAAAIAALLADADDAWLHAMSAHAVAELTEA